MNTFMEEILAEEHRREIMREFAAIRLEEQALNSRVYRPNWFTQIMQGLGQWLITRGEELVKRYEIPESCATSSKHGYAH